MPLYESTFIVRQDLSQSDVSKLSDSAQELIKGQGGDVKKTEYWGLRSLAYRINKNRKGHYAHLGFEAPADVVKELERTLRLNEDVMRVVTIRVDEIDENPSAPLQEGKD